MNGILEAIITPFYPNMTYSRIEVKHKIQKKYFVAFAFVLLAGLVIYHFVHPDNYLLKSNLVLNRLGFVIGLAARIVFTAYILSLVISQATTIGVSFKLSFSIVSLASTILLFPFLFFWMNPQTYAITHSVCLIWYALIIAVGISKKVELPFIKSFGFTLVAVMIVRLISALVTPILKSF